MNGLTSNNSLKNKKMKKLFSMLVLLTFVLTLSAQEQKQEQRKVIINKGEGMMKANPAQLVPQFTPEQKKQIAEFKLTLQKEMIQLNNQLNEKQAQLKTLQQVEKPDMKSIYAKIDEITTIQNKKLKANALNKNNIRAILTDEQRIKFDMNNGNPQRHFQMDKNRRMMHQGNRMHMQQGRMMQQGQMMKQGQRMEQNGKTMERRVMMMKEGKVIKDTVLVKR